MTTPDELRILLESPEGPGVEFKAASGGFHFEDLVKYCVALANEGGGRIVLGVSDRRPRQVVGTKAFAEPGRTEAGLFERLGHRIPVEEYRHEGKRLQNLLWEQNPRNRRIAEVLAKCGLVERAGQGFDLIYRACIQQSKPLPDFSRTSEHSVWVTLYGEIQDREFLRFLEEIGSERLATFGTEDFLVMDLVHREQPVPAYLLPRVQYLFEQGVIERMGRGRGTRYLLSRRFYRFLGKGGVYTRRRGLDRKTNKALLLRHIEDSVAAGATLGELQQVLPGLSRDQVQTLLRELKEAGRVVVQGTTKAARWFPANLKRNPTQ